MKILRILSAALLLGTSALGSAHAPNQPGTLLQAPAPSIYRFAIGKAKVTALSDGTVAIDLHELLRGQTAARTDALLKRAFLSNPVEASINAYLIEQNGRFTLVDTGSGDLFGPGNGGRLPEALREAGVRPEQIGDILLTHIHTDHSGGLMRGGRMLFPNATIHVGKPDVDLFLDPAKAGAGGYDRRYWPETEKTLRPYVDAGRVRTFSGQATILPGIRAELRPGHTPGSAFYTLESEGSSIVFVGDIVHAAAVQFPEPDVTIIFDQDQRKARGVRRAAFESFAAHGTLIAAPHLSFPGVGHVSRAGSGFRWHPVEHADRDASGDRLRL